MIINIFNMTGEPIYTFNIDSGRRWLLNDVAGKPIRLWDMRHHETRNTYDALQRPLSLSLCLSAFVVNLIQKTVYGTTTATNLKGQIAEQYDQSGKTQFGAYDFKGNLLSLSKQLCQDYKQTIDWNRSPALETETFAQTFSYDAMNRPVNITKPDNSLIAHSYNKAGLLETVKARLRGSLSWTDFVTNINYNEKGQRTEIYFANDSKTAYTYDDKTFRLTRLLTTRYKGQDVLQDLNYEYDPVGNITRLRDEAQQTFYFDNAVIAPESRYTYDALYRLTEATGREIKALAMPTHNDFANNIALPNPAGNAMQNYTQRYQYDKLGNIKQMSSAAVFTSWTRNYYYDLNNNRLLNHDGHTDVYDYDAHGNTTAMPHLPALVWDYNDRLKQATLNASRDTAYYVYDASGERVRKVIEKTGGIVEKRIYLGGWEVYRKTISGNLNFERETLHISDNTKKIASIETKTVERGMDILSHPAIRYQYDNHLGSACLELDENAAIISYEEYHPFGTTSYRSGRTETEVSLKRYKYVGKERDEETGLYYYGARYYAGWIGRFVSVDALQHKYPHYTPYQYAGNKPITFIDLDGLEEAWFQNEETRAAVYRKTDAKEITIDGDKYKNIGPTFSAPIQGGGYLNYVTDQPAFISSGEIDVGQVLYENADFYKNLRNSAPTKEMEQELSKLRTDYGKSEWFKGTMTMIGVGISPIALAEGIPLAAEYGPGLIKGGANLGAKGILNLQKGYGNVVDAANKLVLNYPKIFNDLAQSTGAFIPGPFPASLVGNPSLIGELAKLTALYFDNKDYFSGGINNIALDKVDKTRVEPVPLNPADNTFYKKPIFNELLYKGVND